MNPPRGGFFYWRSSEQDEIVRATRASAPFRGLCPKGAQQPSPGQRPGERDDHLHRSPERALQAATCNAPSGLPILAQRRFPGRCPGLGCRAALRLQTITLCRPRDCPASRAVTAGCSSAIVTARVLFDSREQTQDLGKPSQGRPAQERGENENPDECSDKYAKRLGFVHYGEHDHAVNDANNYRDHRRKIEGSGDEK